MAIGKVMHVGCLLAFKLWGFTDWESVAGQQTCVLPLAFSNFNFVFLPIDYGNPRAFCVIEKLCQA